MDTDYNPRIKDDFKRDTFIKKLDPCASEVQSEIKLREKKVQMYEGNEETQRYKP